MSVQVLEVWFEHRHNALGVNTRSPRISWRFEGSARNWVQTSYTIEIRRDTSPETRSVTYDSTQSSLCPWPGLPLQACERAELRVRPSGRAGDGKVESLSWSAWTAVEAGLDTGDWKCKVIESPLDVSGKPHRPIRFRRVFNIPKDDTLERARLYITAHGLFEAEINGRKVGDHVLAPVWTSYAHHLQYSIFDVTEYLKPGRNVLAATIAEGWYLGRIGFYGDYRDIWGGKLAVQAMLVISTKETLNLTINTDDQWKSSFGPLVGAEIYNGETYDARLEQQGWSSPAFDDSAWSEVTCRDIESPERLRLSDGPPIRRTQELKAREMIISPTGTKIVDFGQNLVGWVRVNVAGAQEGHTIVIKHAEVLEKDGSLATRPLRTAAATDTLILAGPEAIVHEPRFTFHGFRYIELQNWPGDFSLDMVTAVVVHSDMKRTGWFTCSDQDVTKLHENVVWGTRGNFVGLPTDCPQRDERLGWTGDIQIFSRSANFLFDTHGLLQDWLRDVDAEQNEDGSGVPAPFTPTFQQDNPYKAPLAIWGDVVVITPWELYQSSGDANILKTQLLSMEAWIQKGIPRDERQLWNCLAVQQLGDWLDPIAPPSEPGLSRTDSIFIANSYLVHVTQLMSQIYQVLGQDVESRRTQLQLSDIRRAFQEEYITPRGRVVCDSQTAIALAIHFSLFDDASQVEVAANRLEEIIRGDSRFKIATGFAGTPILGLALTKANKTQLFYRMLLHKRCPSWLYPVTMGATTIWERWDSMLPDGSINPGEMTSFNHYALGAVVQWMHSVMAGLSPLEPGWKLFEIAPQPGGNITWVSAKHLSPYGMITVDWSIVQEKEKKTTFHLKVSIPPNSRAVIVMPGTTYKEGEKGDRVEVGSGEYEFSVPYEAPPWPPKALYRPFTAHDDDDF